MKVAVPLNMTRVAPRLWYARTFLVMHFEAGRKIREERIDVHNLHPMQIPDALAERGVTTVIAAGVDFHLLQLFTLKGIRVVWGIHGEVEDVINLYRRNGLRPGMGLCPAGRNRHRRRIQGVHSRKSLT